jgi:flagellar basal body-associated protein FliL
MKAFLFFCVYLLGSCLAGAAPAISAALSAASTEVNQSVQLTLTVENARVSRPPTVIANGLSISFTGTSTQTTILNFKSNSKTIFTYIVTPAKEGSFQIPSILISVGSETYRTAPLMLQVTTGDNRPPGNANSPFFGELVVPKEAAYVGEQIPIELRFYFDQRVNYESYPLGQFPLIEGEGFVTRKYPDPSDRQLSVNGKLYRVQVYKTALTGVKPGKLDLASASQQFRVVVGFGPNPSFGGPFQNYQDQIVTVKTNGASIEIKPLPSQGKPSNFSGAIGEFSMSASGAPLSTRVGDPIAMKVIIEGLGNFDRMLSPFLTDQDVWRIYDPSIETIPLDDIGLSATKTYSFPIVPQKKVSNLPTAEFSYFDLNAEKYVTLRSPPIAVSVADLPAQTTPPPALATSPKSTPSLTIQSTNSPPDLDILDIRRDEPPRLPSSRSFMPWMDEPIFWIAQAGPAFLLLLIISGFWVRNLQLARRPVQSLISDQRRLEKELDSTDRFSNFLNASVRLLEIHLRLSSRNEAAQVVEAVLARPDLPDSLRLEIEQLLRKRAEVIYGGLGSESLTPELRSRIKELVRRWRTAV